MHALKTAILSPLLLFTTFEAFTQSSTGRPNVLFIMVDDLRATEFPGNKDHAIITPNIDALALQGFFLKNSLLQFLLVVLPGVAF